MSNLSRLKTNDFTGFSPVLPQHSIPKKHNISSKKQEVINMSLQEFIKLEARALRVIETKDRAMVWKAVECGAMEKVRLYAESLNYEVALNDLTAIIWGELCNYLALSEAK